MLFIKWTLIRKRPHIQQSMFFTYVIPVFFDKSYIIEEGWTQVYYTQDWGNIPSISWLFIYLFFVKCGRYSMPRTLHTNKFPYDHNHKYKTAEMISPWASIVFHPLHSISHACVLVDCPPRWWLIDSFLKISCIFFHFLPILLDYSDCSTDQHKPMACQIRTIMRRNACRHRRPIDEKHM